MIIAPVRLRDRWIDDSNPVELWDEKRRTGLRLAVARMGKTESSLAVMKIWRLTKAGPGASTSVILDLASGEIRDQRPLAGALDPPLDLGTTRR